MQGRVADAGALQDLSFLGYGDGSVRKMSAFQTQGPRFGGPASTQKLDKATCIYSSQREAETSQSLEYIGQ